MKKPKTLTIRFKKDEFQCSSLQFSHILEIIYNTPNLPESLIWICSDVNTNSWYLKLSNTPVFVVHSLKEWECILQNDFQFISGVFIWIQNDISHTFNEELSKNFGTEDEEGFHIESSYIEIRAFDTSYFEIYTLDNKLITKLENIN